MASQKIILVPGFLSPRWMLRPLYGHLKDQFAEFAEVVLWDHPHILSEPFAVADELQSWLERETGGDNVALVTHSFGDWVARKAIQSSAVEVDKLLSICPVIRAVPTARMFAALTRDLVPEVRVMADGKSAASYLELPQVRDHLVIWARWDFWIRRRDRWPRTETRQRTVNGFHNSVIFQPSVWKQAEVFLKSPASCRPAWPISNYA